MQYSVQTTTGPEPGREVKRNTYWVPTGEGTRETESGEANDPPDVRIDPEQAEAAPEEGRDKVHTVGTEA
jgi:hypothetical protein